MAGPIYYLFVIEISIISTFCAPGRAEISFCRYRIAKGGLASKKMGNRTDISDLNRIPNVGPATVEHLNMLGINEPFELIGRNPYSMFEELCRIVDKQFDPCLADVFISAVKFMEGSPPKKWWDYTKERKLHYQKYELKSKPIEIKQK